MELGQKATVVEEEAMFRGRSLSKRQNLTLKKIQPRAPVGIVVAVAAEVVAAPRMNHHLPRKKRVVAVVVLHHPRRMKIQALIYVPVPPKQWGKKRRRITL